MQNGNVRRLLYLSSVAVLAIVVIVRLSLGTEDAGAFTVVAREFLSSVAGAICVWLMGLLFLRIFLSSELRSRETRVWYGDQSAKEFCVLADQASFWFHHGQIGRWVRENVLKEFVRRSSISPAPRRMTLILIDPEDNQVCESHASRRNSRRRKESKSFTAQSIKIEVCTTILCLAKASARHRQISVKVFLSKTDLPFRIDIADTYGFVTHEDQTAPAFGFETDSPFYSTSFLYFESFSSDVARQLNFDPHGFDFESLNVSNSREALNALGVDFAELADRSVRKDIIKCVNEVIS